MKYLPALLLFLVSTPLFAANASPVNITSVTRASNVVTVVDSATSGVTAGFGVCLAGVTDTTYNGCFTVASVTNSTTFTFAQTGSNSSSSGGTTTVAKQIIFLSRNVSSIAGQVTVNYLLWNYTTTGVANSNITSAWNGTLLNGTTDPNFNAEVQALKNGLWIESGRSRNFPTNSTQGQIEQDIQNEWLTTQNALLAPGTVFGCFCDLVGCGC